VTSTRRREVQPLPSSGPERFVAVYGPHRPPDRLYDDASHALDPLIRGLRTHERATALIEALIDACPGESLCGECKPLVGQINTRVTEEIES